MSFYVQLPDDGDDGEKRKCLPGDQEVTKVKKSDCFSPSRLYLDVRFRVFQWDSPTHFYSYEFAEIPQTLPEVVLTPTDFGSRGEIHFRAYGAYKLKRQDRYWGDFVMEFKFAYEFKNKGENRIKDENLLIYPPMVTRSETHGSHALVPHLYQSVMDGQNFAGKPFVRLDLSYSLPSDSDYIEKNTSLDIDLKPIPAGFEHGVNVGHSVNLPSNEQLVGTFGLTLMVHGNDNRASMIAEAEGSVAGPESLRGLMANYDGHYDNDLAKAQTEFDSRIAPYIREWIETVDRFDLKYQGKLPSIRESIRNGEISIRCFGEIDGGAGAVAARREYRAKEAYARKQADNTREYLSTLLSLTKKVQDEKISAGVEIEKHEIPWYNLYVQLDKGELEAALRKTAK